MDDTNLVKFVGVVFHSKTFGNVSHYKKKKKNQSFNHGIKHNISLIDEHLKKFKLRNSLQYYFKAYSCS